MYNKSGDNMIDIIIPVYNTPEKDLERCLNSISNQTYKEYIAYIIDDGSEEKTKVYLDEYIKDKKNFIVKHVENGGVSHARNTGIELSSSEYITFVDSDDEVTPTFLEEAYQLIKEYNLDMVIGGYNEIKDNEIIRKRVSMPGVHIYEEDRVKLFYEKLLSAKTNDENKEIGDCPTGRIYNRLFKRESIKDLRFYSGIMSEDTLYMIDAMKCLKRIAVVDRVWYNYYINEYSISNATKKERMINNIQKFILEIEKRKSNESNERIKKAFDARIEKANNYIDKIKNSK